MNEIQEALRSHEAVIRGVYALEERIRAAAAAMAESIRGGGKVLWMGNGGSAADAQHMAGELVGRLGRERRALPALALTTDGSVLTAIANDYAYADVFSRQVEGLCNPGDVVVGISTSGRSENVLRAMETAAARGATRIAFCGGSGGPLAEQAEIALVVPSEDTQRIQEAHVLLGHLICMLLEAETS